MSDMVGFMCVFLLWGGFGESDGIVGVVVDGLGFGFGIGL